MNSETQSSSIPVYAEPIDEKNRLLGTLSNRWTRYYGFALTSLVLGTLSISPASAQIQFEETTSVASKFDDVESWGASWGDMNGDLWPDLFVTNHRMRPSLFRNNGDGTFTNVVLQWDASRTWLDNPLADEHGGSWSDFDEDGDQDLSVITGIAFDGHLFINNGDSFVESGASFGVTNDREGRLPLWFDYNNDGNIDLAYMSGSSARMFEWTPNAANVPPTEPFPYETVSDFSDSKLGHWCFRNQYGFLIDLDGDDVMELVCASEGNFPQHALDYESGVFEINTELLTDRVSHSVDSTTGDFNGDLLPDILVMRGNLMPNDAQYIPDANGNNTRIESWLSTGTSNGLRTIQFRTQGPVTFTAMSNQIAVPWRIFIGTGATPLGPVENNTGNAITPFTLDPTDAANHGIATEVAGFNPDDSANRGTFVGYDPLADLWSISMSPGSESVRALYVVESSNNITDLNVIGTALRDGPISPAMLINTTTGVDSTPSSMYSPSLHGDLAQQMMCVSAAAGDFDNDMDLDVYVVCRGGVENLANRLFENDGNGYFTEVSNGGGAQGLVGLGLQSKAGTGESVVLADYDVDGYLDLFVTNGLNLQPFREGAQDQLFRNTAANGNHWVEIDLEGTVSNRDGVGASLYATTPDGTVQLREQNGGYHRWSQHHSRVHFGLGANTSFNLDVRWPSGLTETYPNIASNQLIKVIEGTGVTTLHPGQAVGDPAVVAGDECGSPRYLASEDTGLFVWKNCVDDAWTIELVSGDSASAVVQSGSIQSNLAINSVVTDSFEANDILNHTTPEVINFTMAAVNGGRDAFSFELDANASACIELGSPALQVYLGARHVRTNAPFSLIDPSAGCLQLTSADVSVAEDIGNAEIVVSLTGPASQPVTVEVHSVDGTATSISDFTPIDVNNPTTVTFPAGSTSQTIQIPIVDDSTFESLETFNIEFTNATGATTVAAPVTISIIDNDTSVACGKPSYNSAVDRVLAIWKDCGTNNWHMEATAGGGTGINHSGTLESSSDLTAWQAVSFEANDYTQPPSNPANPLHDATPASIDFYLTMSGAGTDGLDFSIDDTATTCLSTSNASIPIIVGASSTTVASPFNINTLQPCVSIDISVGDVSVSEGTSMAPVPVTISASANVTVDLSTIAGSAQASADFLPISSQSVSFVAGGPVTQTIDIGIVDDLDVETTERFQVSLSNVQGASIADATANIDIIDNDIAIGTVCGAPSFLPVAADSARALYIWNDCGTDQWRMRATSGNTGTAADHTGTLTIVNGSLVSGIYPINPPYNSATQSSTYGKVSFEGVDSFSLNANVVDYRFKMNGPGYDGVDFEVTPATSLCLNTTGSDSSLVVLLGANATPAPPGAFDLGTLNSGSCSQSTLPTVTISDLTTVEGSGPAVVNLTLSEPPTSNVSVAVTTTNGTATAGNDYTPIAAAQLVNFVTGGPSVVTLPIPVIDDLVTESNETFTVNLSNANGLIIGDNMAVVTIVDDDTSVSCGAPSSIDPGNERALFMWRDCGSRVWHLRATAGGSGQPAATHLGQLAVTGSLINQNYPANVPYDNSIISSRFARQSFEGIDLIIAPPGANPLVEYQMKMSNAGIDGFDFETNPSTSLCLTNLSTALPILLGSQKTPASGTSFNPDTNQFCN